MSDISENLKNLRKAKFKNRDKVLEHFGKDTSDGLTLCPQTLSKWENDGNINNMSVGQLLKLCELYDCDINSIVYGYPHRSLSNKEICDETGLSENALNSLKRISKRDTKESEYIIKAINKLLEKDYNSSALFWIGLLIFGQLNKGGYLYQTKDGLKEQSFVDMGQLGKGIHFYGGNGDRLTLDADLLNTAIFDKIRKSLENLEKIQNKKSKKVVS